MAEQGNPSQKGSGLPYNYGYNPMSYSYGDKADLLEKIKPEHIVHVFMHQLMGERFEDGIWKKDPELQKRALAKIGAWDIANLMLSASSQNVALSNLQDDEIRARAMEIAWTAQVLCLRNWKLYGIRGRDHIYFIHQIVFGNSLISLKQSQNEGIRALLKGTTSEVRAVTQTEDKGNFLMNLFRGRSKK